MVSRPQEDNETRLTVERRTLSGCGIARTSLRPIFSPRLRPSSRHPGTFERPLEGRPGVIAEITHVSSRPDDLSNGFYSGKSSRSRSLIFFEQTTNLIARSVLVSIYKEFVIKICRNMIQQYFWCIKIIKKILSDIYKYLCVIKYCYISSERERERERKRENIKNLFISFGKNNITLFKSRLYIKIII